MMTPFPTELSMPMKASGYLYEATVPVKLPGSHCSYINVSPKLIKLRYVPHTIRLPVADQH